MYCPIRGNYGVYSGLIERIVANRMSIVQTTKIQKDKFDFVPLFVNFVVWEKNGN